MDIVTNAGFHLSKKHLEHLKSYQFSKEVMKFHVCVSVCVYVCDKKDTLHLHLCSTKTYHCMTVNQGQHNNADPIFSVLISAVIAVQLTR
jgi:hypothetical protein